MLGALISFIGFVLAIFWWNLSKQFRKFRKGEATMPVFMFSIYCLLSILVLGFILSVVFSVVPEFLPRSSRHQLENSPGIMFGFVFLFVILFVAYQCYRYAKIARRTIAPLSVEDVDLGDSSDDEETLSKREDVELGV
jgi:uncharacterized membrane protein